MQRAALLIGVQEAESLTPLKAVLDGVRAMQIWAETQPISAIEVVTDETERVTIDRILDAIERLLASGPPEQLVVYFAGHGINKVYNEYWLLSRAISRPSEAVNVTASAALARQCGVRHVVFISDACRTSPEGIGAEAVTGAPIFPALQGNRPGSVDLFFANQVGAPAFEIANEAVAAGRFTSAFTDVVSRSLNGIHADLLEERGGEPGMMVLRPWPLNRALPSLLLDELTLLGVDLRIDQQPEAVISSDPAEAWLSVVPTKRSIPFGPKTPTPPTTTEKVGQQLATGSGLTDDLGQVAANIASVDWSAIEPVAPGVRVHGTAPERVVDGPDATFVAWPEGLCTNLARQDGYECRAVFDGRDLVSVHWESTDRDPPSSIVTLRSSLAAASQAGRLRLDSSQADTLAAQPDGRDLAIELYLSYAHPPTSPDDAWFDNGLLRDPAGITTSRGATLRPGFPMLSRGFGLLQSLNDQQRTSEAGQIASALSQHVSASHWSVFALDAEPLLLQLLDSTRPT